MQSQQMLDSTLAQLAERDAHAAAAAAGVTVFVLQEREELEAATQLFSEIWAVDGTEPVMTSTVMTALAHSGNYVAGASYDGELVGASVGFLGHRDDRVVLHSHITGIAPRLQGRKLGFALKQHQRSWALHQRLDEITWTFDPLVRRNGFFNIAKLGAEIVEYHTDFYGEMGDSINKGDASDRCLVSWKLRSDRAILAASGRAVVPDRSHAAHTLLDIRGGEPTLSRSLAPQLLAYVPKDIVEMRRADPPVASRWRQALRDALQWSFSQGYTVTGMNKAGCYVLNRPR